MEQAAQSLTSFTDQKYPESGTTPTEVLVVIGDESEFRELKGALDADEIGFTAYHVSTASEAVEFCQNNAVDCLVLADSLSGANGPQLIAQLRNASRSLSLPVIYLREDSPDEILDEVKQIGSSDVIDLSEIGADCLAERIHRLMWQTEVDDALANHHLRSELMKLHQSRQQDFLRDEVEAMTHALRTPLAAIEEFITLIQDGAGGRVKRQQKKLLALAKGSCETLDREIGKLHSIVDLQDELGRAHKRPHMLRDLVEITGRVADEDAAAKSVELELSVDPKLSAVRCNALKICEVLLSLVTFGTKYVGPGGKVRLGAQAGIESGVQTLSVSLQPQKNDNVVVFDALNPDAKQKCSPAEQFDFAGHILEAHGTELEVSNKENQVTELTFELPCFYAAFDGENEE